MAFVKISKDIFKKGDNMTYEDWLERLKKNNPNITWELISENVMNELKESFNETFEREDK